MNKPPKAPAAPISRSAAKPNPPPSCKTCSSTRPRASRSISHRARLARRDGRGARPLSPGSAVRHGDECEFRRRGHRENHPPRHRTARTGQDTLSNTPRARRAKRWKTIRGPATWSPARTTEALVAQGEAVSSLTRREQFWRGHRRVAGIAALRPQGHGRLRRTRAGARP